MSGGSPFVPKRGLINIKPRTPQRGGGGGGDADLHNFSITLMPGEIQRMLDNSQMNTSGLFSSSFHGAAMGDTTSICERSLLDHPQIDVFKEKADMLFPQFLEVLQARTNDSEVFDTIQDLIHTCSGVLEDCLKDVHRGGMDIITKSKAEWLEMECKTWKLLYALYKDRVLLQSNDPGMDCDIGSLGGSEKEIIAQLYNCNSTLREYQLIIDWLEACYEKKMTGPEVGHTTDRTVAWENTLFQLKKQQQIAFGSGTEIVKSLDPDAPIREKKPLHALDEEDNMRLSRCIFEEIRQGRIDEAMSLCKYCGQTWRAAILEGWRLHEDPNYEPNYGNNREKMPIEGNPRRDIWKKCAWMMADSKKFDEYTRAIAGAFCGHLESLKSLLSNSWEDLLWAYLKVQVDIRVESEIRANCMKPYHTMPEDYWNSKMSMEQIFDELLVHNDAAVRDYAQSKIGIIQKFLILDNIAELLQQIRRWIEEDQLLDSKDLSASHMLRFLTHIVLFMRQIGRVDKEDTADRIIAAYVESLIPMKDAQLVAFYTAALPGKTQVTLYANFLATIMETSARQTALEEAMGAGLDIENITRHTVETIRQKEPTEAEIQQMQEEPLQQGDISSFDQQKIKVLEWLTFLPSQRGDLLWQGNAMIRSFLAENKMECVRAVYDMIPQDSLTHIINTYGSKDNLPCREDCSIKEYLSYKVYLAAIDSFNEWSRLYHNRPKEPQLVNAGANFTERMASEHKEQVYRAELNRWNVSLEEQAKVCRDSLYNVLLFPEKGWLIDPDTPKDPTDISSIVWESRQIQLDKIRSICIPEVTLLLHKVLHLSEDYQGCVKLADEIASENRELYKVYTKHKLAELLAKLAESSLELLNKKLDPWGFPVTV
ncbi:nuclear pore complex protein Nup107 [Haematobia irritans]|uniref:nuclear pore complex protein Nup107 n=1 Tax=Haematobia irritans TaxID=7368 RepID=UPI003F4F9D9E